MLTFNLTNSNFKNYIQELKDKNYIFTTNEKLTEISSYINSVNLEKQNTITFNKEIKNIAIFVLLPNLNYEQEIFIEINEEDYSNYLMIDWQDKRKCKVIYINVNIMHIHKNMQFLKDYLTNEIVCIN